MLNGVKGKDDGDSDSLSAYSLKSNHLDKTVTVTSWGMTLQKDSSNFNCGKGIRDERAKFTQKNERLYK